ncbi:PapD-like protein [Zychaea mexicana]|uniref:PapD-like protein n=1 Tax=Zychaea mexicana TaxID=64656 RepID=UPI0022FE16E1|nr:PapD-like protein [Zychaea mexicana]KAI9488844.1 PapD-like protein [Zychaea mexicana]
MSVQIEPEQFLTFQRPLTRVVEEKLAIRNPNSGPVAFKVKTTAPKQYCVRPNSGIINPNATREVQVMLQPFKTEPEPDYRCKDKFLVQTVLVSADKELLPINDLWTQVEAGKMGAIKQHKLRCAFLPVNAEVAHTEPVVADLSNGTHRALSAAPEVRDRQQQSVPEAVAPLQNDYSSTQNEMRQMKEKLLEYEREMLNIRQMKEPAVTEVIQAPQGYPIQVLVMVAIAVFAMSYAIFATKQ